MSETTQEMDGPATKKMKLGDCDELFDEHPDTKNVLKDKYENYVTLEELEKLKEFQVLDEVKSDDEDSNDDDSYSSDGRSEDLPEEEIEKMLEEDLPEGFKGAPKPKEKAYITRQKIVLEEKGVNHFEVLPLDWMMVRHYSGMPVYVHRTSRVCTLSKPYFLGKGNTRRHDIPISAIPCLAYRRALQEEEKQKEIDQKIEEQIKMGMWSNGPVDNQEVPNVAARISNAAIAKTTKCDSNKIVSNKCPFRFSSIVSDSKAADNTDSENNLPVTSENCKGDTNNEIVNDDISNDRLVDNVKKENVIRDKPIENATSCSETVPVEIAIDENVEVDREKVNMTQETAIDAPKEDIDDSHLMDTDELDNGIETENTSCGIVSENQKIEISIEKVHEDTEINVASTDAANGNVTSAVDTDGVDSIVECLNTNNTPSKSHQNMTEHNDADAETNDNPSQETVGRTVRETTDISRTEKADSEKTKDATQGTNAETSESATQQTNADQPSANEIPRNRQPVILPGGVMMPPPRVETVSTSWKTQHLTHEQVNEYCKRLFKFKTVNIMHFMRWADRRKYTKARKTLQYPTLPEGTKLITIPAQPLNKNDNGGSRSKRDWVMNMNGRSYLSVFHEYVRRALQKQPQYEFVQLENASTPYQATVYIGGMQYGVGHGSSKRQAKSAAARASIHILIPEMKDELDAGADAGEPDFSFFDYVGIEDPRITEFCAATCEPSPHAILRTCLLRNFGATDRHIHTEMKKLEFQKIELTMKVGKHSATVVCKNKKSAKQRASQAILQALHPHVRSWGSLLRLYGSRSVKSCKEKKLEEQQITLLQDKARHNEPNYAVLDKLRHEMRKLRERDEAVVPIGTLLLHDDLPTHSGANLNNVDL